MRSRRRRLMTACPKTGQIVPTQFVEDERRIGRFEGRIVYWCPICHAAHGLSFKRGKPERTHEAFGAVAFPVVALAPAAKIQPTM